MFPLIHSDDKKNSDIIREYMDEIYCSNKSDEDNFLFAYRTIDNYQRKDKQAVNKLKEQNSIINIVFGEEL